MQSPACTNPGIGQQTVFTWSQVTPDFNIRSHDSSETGWFRFFLDAFSHAWKRHMPVELLPRRFYSIVKKKISNLIPHHCTPALQNSYDYSNSRKWIEKEFSSNWKRLYIFIYTPIKALLYFDTHTQKLNVSSTTYKNLCAAHRKKPFQIPSSIAYFRTPRTHTHTHTLKMNVYASKSWVCVEVSQTLYGHHSWSQNQQYTSDLEFAVLFLQNYPMIFYVHWTV